MRVESLTLLDVLESCADGDPGTALVVFDAVLSSVGSTDRYDISLFLGLDGNSALNGGLCYHDYLEPPLTTTPSYGDSNGNTVPDLYNGPWANLEPFVPSDDCGDMNGGTEVIKTLASPSVPLRIDCVDTDEDGGVDLSVCAGWRAGNQGSCGGLNDAIAEASSRCSCSRVELTGLPEPGAAPSLVAGLALLAALVRRPAGRRRR